MATKIIRDLVIPSTAELSFSQGEMKEVENFCTKNALNYSFPIKMRNLLGLHIGGEYKLVSLCATQLELSVDSFLKSLYIEPFIHSERNDFGEEMLVCNNLSLLERLTESHSAYLFCTALSDYRDDFEEKGMKPILMFDGVKMWFATSGSSLHIEEINPISFFVNNDECVEFILKRVFN